MATTPSSMTRIQTSSPITELRPGVLVTTVTQRRPPNRQTVPPILALPKEPEDARITGGTRSLDRRLLALNLSVPHSSLDAA